MGKDNVARKHVETAPPRLETIVMRRWTKNARSGNSLRKSMKRYCGNFHDSVKYQFIERTGGFLRIHVLSVLVEKA